MIYIKWLVLALIDWALLLTIPIAAPIIAVFTRAELYGQTPYTWGWLWGTHDNPPQGDEGFVSKRAPFLEQITGWRGYLNRIAWMIRNPLYGYARLTAIDWHDDIKLDVIGKDGISDKYGIPGWYFVRVRLHGKLIGFEFYGVFPYSKARDLRVRLGWKVLTSKFKSTGFAQIVNSISPFDGYGPDK